MAYNRKIEEHIEKYLAEDSNKIFFMWGPRRAGKTFIMRKISEKLKVPLFNFDLRSDQEKFLPDRSVLSKLASALPVILIDEVQNFPEATVALKILFDEFKVKIIATGSSELRRKSTDFDSLAGRFIEYNCLPLSASEIKNNLSVKPYEESVFSKFLMSDVSIYGSYPEIYGQKKSEAEKIDLLQNIFDTYVLKDIVDIYNLRNAKLAKDILVKVALQIGSEISVRELANSLGSNTMTVSNYLEIFIKNYILLPLPAFKTNLRRAVSAHRKLYFLDLGLRNILIKDFRPLDLRPDKGGVFENFIIAEFFKKVLNDHLHCSFYFYREYGGKEVDLVAENYKKEYFCFESKFNGHSVSPIFPLPHKLETINQKNYFNLIESLCQFSDVLAS
ncbi:MAG: ATP-binding protein [Candidatus Magasanikbacteria bacterium]|nr:ATP-binding protein [Candidatus Magasanikbacteria bacterium]